MITVELANRSGVAVAAGAVEELCRATLEAEGVTQGDLGVAWVGPDEMRALKRDHLGIDEPTDVLSFPIDGRDDLPEGVPRQLGDVVVCPQVVGDDWRWPLVHGLLHLLGYAHGAEMERRERELVSHQAIHAGLSPAIARPEEPALPAAGPTHRARGRERRRDHLKGYGA